MGSSSGETTFPSLNVREGWSTGNGLDCSTHMSAKKRSEGVSCENGPQKAKSNDKRNSPAVKEDTKTLLDAGRVCRLRTFIQIYLARRGSTFERTSKRFSVSSHRKAHFSTSSWLAGSSSIQPCSA